MLDRLIENICAWDRGKARGAVATNYAYTLLGPFPVQEMTAYRLKLTVQQRHQKIRSIYRIVYLHNGQVLSQDGLFNFRSDIPGAPLSISREFGTPKKANQIKLYIGAASRQRPQTSAAARSHHESRSPVVGNGRGR